MLGYVTSNLISFIVILLYRTIFLQPFNKNILSEACFFLYYPREQAFSFSFYQSHKLDKCHTLPYQHDQSIIPSTP